MWTDRRKPDDIREQADWYGTCRGCGTALSADGITLWNDINLVCPNEDCEFTDGTTLLDFVLDGG